MNKTMVKESNMNILKNNSAMLLFEILSMFYVLLTSGNSFVYLGFISVLSLVTVFVLIKKGIIKKAFPFYYIGIWLYVSVVGVDYELESAYNLLIFIAVTLIVVTINFRLDSRGNIGNIKYGVIIKIILSAIIAFSFFGYKFFVSDYSNTKRGCVLFILAIYWGNEFIDAFEKIILFLKEKNKQLSLNTKISEKKLFFIVFLVFACTGILMSIIYYPGMISYEGQGFWDDATHLGDILHRTEQRSFILTLLWAVYAKITSQIYFMTLLLVLLMAYLWTRLTMVLYRKGLSSAVIITFAVCWSIVPMNMFMTITLFKDNFYAIALFAVFVITIEILLNNDLRLLKACILGACAFFMATFRPNGMLPFAITLLISVVMFIKYREKIFKRFMAVMLIVACCLALYKGPITKYFEIQPVEEGYSVAFLLDGIWECIYQEKQLPDWIEEYMYSIVPEEQLKEYYVETYLNCFFWEDQFANKNISKEKTIKAYAYCLKEYPFTLIKARLKKCFNIWSVFPPHANEDYRQRIFNESVIENEYGWEYIDKLQPIRNAFLGYYQEDNIINRIFGFVYRSGFNLCILCGVLWLLIKQGDKRYFLTIAGVAGNIFSVMIACCYRDYRYTWTSFIIASALTIVMITPEIIKISQPEKTKTDGNV